MLKGKGSGNGHLFEDSYSELGIDFIVIYGWVGGDWVGGLEVGNIMIAFDSRDSAADCRFSVYC